MKNYFSYIFILTLFGCTRYKNENIPDKIINSRTNKHILVPGTRLYINPTGNFKLSDNYTGLFNDKNAQIYIFDNIETDFKNKSQIFLEDIRSVKGLKVKTQQEFLFDNYQSLFIIAESSGFKQYYLLFGDSSFSEKIIAIVPKGEHVLEDQAEDAVLSAYYDKSVITVIPNIKGFKLDDRKSKMKLEHYSAMMYEYSFNGIKNDLSAPYLNLVTIPKDSSMSLHDLSTIMLKKFFTKGISNIQIESSSASQVNGFKSYELVANGISNGVAILIYQLLAENDTKRAVIAGVSTKVQDSILVEFRNLSNTIIFK